MRLISIIIIYFRYDLSCGNEINLDHYHIQRLYDNDLRSGNEINLDHYHIQRLYDNDLRSENEINLDHYHIYITEYHRCINHLLWRSAILRWKKWKLCSFMCLTWCLYLQSHAKVCSQASVHVPASSGRSFGLRFFWHHGSVWFGKWNLNDTREAVAFRTLKWGKI